MEHTRADFPVSLNLEGRNTVVVGGGTVGFRKAQVLFDAGANVVVIEPNALCERWHSLLARGVRHLRKSFEPRQLKGAFLVVAATSDPVQNDRVIKAAREMNVLTNRADGNFADAGTRGRLDSYPGDVAFGALHRRGPVTIAVHARGTPALAAYVRDLAAQTLPDDFEKRAEFLLRLRRIIIGTLQDPPLRRTLIRKITSSLILDEAPIPEEVDLEQWLVAHGMPREDAKKALDGPGL